MMDHVSDQGEVAGTEDSHHTRAADHYKRTGKMGANALKKMRGSAYYRELAQRGGQANMRKYGVQHFSHMGKKGGNTTRTAPGI